MSYRGIPPVRRAVFPDANPRPQQRQRTEQEGDNVAAGMSFYNLLCQEDVGWK